MLKGREMAGITVPFKNQIRNYCQLGLTQLNLFEKKISFKYLIIK